jgi:hypothetical protein
MNDSSIYEVSSHGWLNENDPDHAMWQIDQAPLDHSALFGQGPVQRRPKERKKKY